MWYNIFLSAVFFNLAFFWPSFFGFLILGFLVLLRPKCSGGLAKGERLGQYGLRKGFIWGLLVFGPHFIWLVVLLMTKSQAPLSLAILGYLVVVCYFSLTSGVWFWGAGLCHKIFLGRGGKERPAIMLNKLFFFLISITYYYFLENFSLFIFGRLEGYPFLNPLIPLAEYRPMLWLVAKAGALVRWITFGGAVALTPLTPGDINLMYLSPIKGEQNSAVAVGQRIYHELARNMEWLLKNRIGWIPDRVRDDKKEKQAEPLIVVAPESFYQFSLNRHPEQVVLWSSIMPKNTHLIIGTQMSLGPKIYQAAALIQKGLINKYYVKHHCVPFVEKIPKLWKRVDSLRDMFLQNADEFSRGRLPLSEGVFDVGQDVNLIPQICSEFFFKLPTQEIWRISHEQPTKKQAVLFLINDSWFIEYLQRIMKRVAGIKAAYLGLPVIYVGHGDLTWYR